MSASHITVANSPSTERTTGLSRATLLQKLGGYMNTQLLYILAKLGIADHLAAGSKSSEALAADLNVAKEPLHRILRGCVNSGLLIETEPGVFATTPPIEFLESNRADSLRSYVILTGEEWYTAWNQLIAVVESGAVPFEVAFGCDHYTHFAQKPESSVRFNQFMQIKTEQSAQGLIEAYDFSEFSVVVDIGGGNGTLLQSILHKYPQLQGILFDLPPVITEAKQSPVLQQLGQRCRFVSGRFTDGVPNGGDLYILSQILHNWSDEQCIEILRNCHAAMSTQGKLLILEMLIPNHLRGNIPAVDSDLMMLAVTQGRERNEVEYKALLAAANLKLSAVYPLKRLGFSAIEAQKEG